MTNSGAARPARDDRGEVDSLALFASEIGLLALALGTTLGFGRLLSGWSFAFDLGRLVVVAWLAALLLRRLRVPLAPSIAAHFGLGLISLTLAFAPTSSFFGLPTLTTARTLSEAVSTSFADVPDLVAPVVATSGFLIVIAGGLWMLALFSDVAAFRFRGPVQAAIPYGAVFLATGLLAREERRLVSAVCFVAGLAVYAATEAFLQNSNARWVADARRGARSIAVSAGLIVVVASVGALLLGPAMPGDSDPVLKLREVGKGPGPRSVVSPFVGIRSLLGQRTNAEMFTVHASRPSYWRLTALERYDADQDIWVSSASYSSASGELRSNTSDRVPATPLRQEIAISGLDGPWLPAAYQPFAVSSTAGISFDSEGSSLILADENDNGVRYSVVSRVPDFWTALQGASSSAVSMGPKYLDHPKLDAGVRSEYEDLMRGLSGPVERMRALQDWFRSEFSYDESVNFSKASNPLASFFEERRGFCQQFASAFALLARYDGIPSRVAVGFTTGDAKPADSADQPQREGFDFVVRGRHAHAWPEVYFEGIGWVSYEPTPGRGNPATAAYTGAEAAQAAPSPAMASTTSISGTPTSTPGDSVAPTTSSPKEKSPVITSTDADSKNTRGTRTALILGLVTVAAVALITWRMRYADRSARKRGGSVATNPAERISHIWATTLLVLSDVGIEASGTETPLEFARRAERELATLLSDREDEHVGNPGQDLPAFDEVASAIHVLANGESLRRYSSDGVPSDFCDQAEQSLLTVERLSDLKPRRRGGNALSLAGLRH